MNLLYFRYEEVSEMTEINEKRQAYIEEFSFAMEGFGLSRMAGRVFAALLIADPAEQSAEDLAKQLKASRGGISGAVNLLEHAGLIERTRKLGDRRDYFRNKPNAMYESLKASTMMITQFTGLVDKGFELINEDDSEVSRGLIDLKEYISFFNAELPKLFERFEASLREKEKT